MSTLHRGLEDGPTQPRPIESGESLSPVYRASRQKWDERLVRYVAQSPANTRAVALVGHEPILGALVGHCLSRRTSFVRSFAKTSIFEIGFVPPRRSSGRGEVAAWPKPPEHEASSPVFAGGTV